MEKISSQNFLLIGNMEKVFLKLFLTKPKIFLIIIFFIFKTKKVSWNPETRQRN